MSDAAENPRAVPGDNSESPTKVARDQLKAFVERVARLTDEKKQIADDIRDVFLEAKGQGFDVKVLRKVIRLCEMDPNERAEEQAVLETYLNALGMVA